MNRILVVCLGLGLALAAQPARESNRESSVAGSQAAPALQSGITVQMPTASNAASMPGADQESALIVTVTRDGKVYLGVTAIDPEALNNELRDSASAEGPGKTLYVKADARASYAIVIKVLDNATRAGFERTVLLTNQNEPTQPGTVAPPKGFTVTGAARHPRLSL
jgi:biopolymer transport protein ExbD